MENFDGENIDELLEIRQIRQYFPHQNFALYGNSRITLNIEITFEHVVQSHLST